MIKVLRSGFYTSIQDLGRFGFGNMGVPNSGAMDQFSSQWANQFLGNSKNDAVLEITQGNCHLLFKKQTLICITGADCSASLNQKIIAINTPIKVVKGDILHFGKPIDGIRTYLAVKGGFMTEQILNSRSYYQGISTKARVQKGDLLPFPTYSIKTPQTSARVKINKHLFTNANLQADKGPEYELLSNIQKEQLEQLKFTISKDHSRMGYRLEETIANTIVSQLTSAVLPGTVQLTPSGKLIVLMRDCQVTGGYPRVLQLTESAINQLAQKNTGDSFKFLIS